MKLVWKSIFIFDIRASLKEQTGIKINKNIQVIQSPAFFVFQIMEMISSCRTLFRYLCSDENESGLPKPHDKQTNLDFSEDNTS